MRSSADWLVKILTLFVAAVFAIGCGGGEKPSEDAAEAGGVELKITKEEVPPGALPDVAAELGGEGFVGAGWESNFDYEPIGDPRAVKGGQFTWALYEFPSTLRTQGKDSNSQLLFIMDNLIYESLTGLHSKTMQIVPGLATHWKISDDKKTFWFRINPNARFSDGSRVTAADVIATWKLRVDPGILAPYTNVLWEKFEEPVAESPYIVRVQSKELNWRLFIYFGGMNIMPAKYLSKMSGSDYMKACQFKMLPGSGVYVLDEKSFIKGRSLTLKRRTDYWDHSNPKAVGVANFDRIKFVVVNDERLMFEKFKKGELDAYQVGRAQWWVEQTDFDNVKRGLVQKRKIYNDDPQGINGFVLNMRLAPFNDLRMRQAIAYLVNREKLIPELFFNEYLMLDSYHPGGIYADPDNPKIRFNPDKAVALMKECGWKNRNAEGWLINDKGELLELDLTYSSQGMERIFTVIQEDFKKVGIKLNLKQSTQATEFKMVNEHKFKIHWQNWTGLFFPNPESSWSSWTADPENTTNLAGVKDARIDTLCKEYNVTFDQERRIEIIREIDRILMEIQPYALGWYGPFHRILYWNKFGHPDYYFTRTGEWSSMLTLWWVDPEKEKRLEAAKKNADMQLEVGELDVLYWPKFNAEHGQKWTVEGL